MLFFFSVFSYTVHLPRTSRTFAVGTEVPNSDFGALAVHSPCAGRALAVETNLEKKNRALQNARPCITTSESRALQRDKAVDYTEEYRTILRSVYKFVSWQS